MSSSGGGGGSGGGGSGIAPMEMEVLQPMSVRSGAVGSPQGVAGGHRGRAGSVGSGGKGGVAVISGSRDEGRQQLLGHRRDDVDQRPPHQRHPLEILDKAWVLLRMYVEFYPRVTAFVVSVAIISILSYCFRSASNRRHHHRNRMHHDYTDIDIHYNFLAAQMDHFCLFGNDDDRCHCEDFLDPEDRHDVKGWTKMHAMNKKLAKTTSAPPKRDSYSFDGGSYDVVFVGDDVVERWYHGTDLSYDLISREGYDQKKIMKSFQRYFNTTYKEKQQKKYKSEYEDVNPNDFDGLGLGISFDSTSNLLWRLQNGEMPEELNTKVWWLVIGTNDLSRGECSEEGTVLGILRSAEEISFHYPDSVVVVQAILPRTTYKDGSLLTTSTSLWPSIKRVNKQLEIFCEKHARIVYYDPSALFIGRITNAHYKQATEHIMTELMPDGVHLSHRGYDVLGKSVMGELQKIILDDEEDNDVETTAGGY